jgi:hypothetical protein
MKKTARWPGLVGLVLLLLWSPWHGIADPDIKSDGPVRPTTRQNVIQYAAKVAPATSPMLPQGLRVIRGERSRQHAATARRVTSVLQKLGKTLILEHTRGSKEMAVYRQASPRSGFGRYPGCPR